MTKGKKLADAVRQEGGAISSVHGTAAIPSNFKAVRKVRIKEEEGWFNKYRKSGTRSKWSRTGM